MVGRTEFLDELAARIGAEAVIRNAEQIEKSLRDNSWLSPILTEHFDQRRSELGNRLQVDAAVFPANVGQLRDVVALCVRHDVPLTLRGGGTSNFGQAIPLEGGIIVDTRRLNKILDIGDDFITAEAGAIQADLESAARARGREMTVLTTTAASATVAGWVAGGHVGIGSSAYGTIWDGNVLKITMLTAEDPPRELTLTGDDLYPLLHTYGTTGVMTAVTFPLVTARHWIDAIGIFDTFDAAAHFTADISEHDAIAQRVVAAQEWPVPPVFTPLRPLFRDGQSIVLLIVAAEDEQASRELARHYGGELKIWRKTGDERKVPLSLMVYGHRMLWVKRQAPNAAFLNCYFSPDRLFEQIAAIKNRFGDDVWMELKYVKSGWLRKLRGLPPGGTLPAPLLGLVPGDRAFVETVMGFCDAIGVSYQNPHTFVLEESGLFPDFAPIIAFKKQTDPKGLLNPGKISARFFTRSER